MLKNYLKTTLRSLSKNKAFVVINVIGIGLATACCITAYTNYQYTQEFDKSLKDKEHIFRVNSERVFQNELTRYGICPMPLANQINQNIPGIENIIRYDSKGTNFKIEEDVFASSLAYADTDFFDVFSFELIYGDRSGLSDASNIFISDQLSIKYFGTTESVGKQLSIILPNKKLEYKVGGVFKKLKLNNSFYFDAITSMDNYFLRYEDISENNWAQSISLFLKISDLNRIQDIENSIQDHKTIANEVRHDFEINRFYLDSFEGIALRSRDEEIRRHGLRRAQPKAAVVAPWVMAIMLLLTACFNFTNTSISVSSKRLKEIGIRKVLGSYKSQLVFQFLTENIIICTVGLLTGLVMAEFLVPAYSNLWPFLELELNYAENSFIFVFLTALLLFTAIFSGAYPAFYISSFQPTTILKGNTKFAGTNFFTRILLFIQYSVCIVALVMGFAFMENAKYQQEMDLGYETNGVLSIRMNSLAECEKLRNSLNKNPEIIEVIESADHLFSSWINDPVRYNNEEAETDIMRISHDYIDFMVLELLEGRNFTENSESDFTESVIVNQEFVRTFGMQKPLGEKVIYADSMQLYIVGVVKDFYTRAYFGPVLPMMFRYSKPENHRNIIVKFPPEKYSEINSFIKNEYKSLFPNFIYQGRLMDDELENSEKTNENVVKIFFFLAVIALVLTSIGLYSLVSLNILKKMKEIGVRKVMGATVTHIIQKLNREFIIILTGATIVGIPIAYFLTSVLMDLIWEQFLNPTVFAMSFSAVIIFLVSAITISTLVYKAATSNPVTTLRSE